MRENAVAQVAIVDEDQRFRALLAGQLERSGLRVREYASGEDALAEVGQGLPSVVLVEVRLPGICGYEVCWQLRQELGDAVSIALVSDDRTEPRDRVAGLLVGADDYIVKPPEPDETVARVRALARRAKGSPSDERGGRLGELTRREREVLRLLADGLRQAEIAERLVISPKTVAGHIERILQKLGVHSRAEAVAFVYQERAGP